jgi:AcrR family transcriptional regulator
MDEQNSANLQPRREPLQARSRKRVELILATTRTLLGKDGLNSVTTTRIAAKAGIPVSSVYQYFPSKKAIFAALYEDYLRRIRDIFDEFQQTEYMALGWEVFFTRMLTTIHSAELRDNIVNELEKAISVYPELLEIDSRHGELAVERMVQLFQELGSEWPRPRLRRMARFLYSLNASIWKYRAQFHPPEKELLEWEVEASLSVIGLCFEEGKNGAA